MRRTHNATWIIGIILLVVGILQIILALPKRNIGALILGFLVLAVGVALTVAGIVVNAGVKKENRRFLQTYEGKVFIGTCHHCDHEVECYAEDFQEHRNFPEGFVYCPVCKKPLSINAFSVFDEGDYYDDVDYYDDADEWEEE